MKHISLLITFYIGILCSLCAQKDTEFWFVCPEVSNGGSGNYDHPVAFRFSTYELSATVLITQPANPSFTPISIFIPENSTNSVLFPPYFNAVENTPPNTVLNKGFYIESTNPITAYYEVIGTTPHNPEVFSLKGKNAIGKTFFIPFQTVANNTNTFNPLPYAAFDIVATEDGTILTIIPTKPIIGSTSIQPLIVFLNKGQTYSAQSPSLLANEHPSGTKVTANKPVSITMKDDGLDGGAIFGNFCRDLTGTQIVPIEKIGTKYVVQKGFLNGNEFAFAVSTSSNTHVIMDGTLQGILGEGQLLVLPITNGSHFVESSAPIYLHQMTGIGCELASEILPALDCTGSSAVRFVRSTNESFYLFLVTESGNESGFTLNGIPSHIPPNSFQPVPGSNGQYVSAVISFSNFQVPTNQSSIIENSLGDFQMGFLNGGVVTGCRFGFFSDFGNLIPLSFSISLCPGESITVNGQTYSQPTTVFDTIPGIQGCDTLVTYDIELANYDLTFQIDSLSCSNGQTSLHYTLCNILGGALPPEVYVALYDSDPSTAPASHLGNIVVQALVSTSCISGTLSNLSALLPSTTNPCPIFTLTNFDGSKPGPISLSNFPTPVFEECNYSNNLNNFLVQLPEINAQARDEICNRPGSILVTSTFGIPPFEFNLNAGPWVNTPVFDNLPAGTYLLSIRDAQGCLNTSTYTIRSYTPIAVQIDSIRSIDCRREKGLISVSASGGNQPYSFRIDNGSPQPDGVFNNLETGVFSIVVADKDSCEVRLDGLAITESTDTSLTSEMIDLCSGLFIVLPNGDSINHAGSYPVVLSRENGCDSTIVFTIGISPNNFYVPNVFAPGRPGLNESFSVFTNPACIQNVSLLQVYDRWGNLVFEHHNLKPNDYTQGWRGDYRGQPLPPGVYTYLIELQLTNGLLIPHHGNVTLIR